MSALGIAAVLAASATVFTVLKLAGAAYLVYLGVQSLRSLRRGEERIEAPKPAGSPFRQGLVTNLLEPEARSALHDAAAAVHLARRPRREVRAARGGVPRDRVDVARRLHADRRRRRAQPAFPGDHRGDHGRRADRARRAARSSSASPSSSASRSASRCACSAPGPSSATRGAPARSRSPSSRAR